MWCVLVEYSSGKTYAKASRGGERLVSLMGQVSGLRRGNGRKASSTAAAKGRSTPDDGTWEETVL